MQWSPFTYRLDPSVSSAMILMAVQLTRASWSLKSVELGLLRSWTVDVNVAVGPCKVIRLGGNFCSVFAVCCATGHDDAVAEWGKTYLQKMDDAHGVHKQQACNASIWPGVLV